MFDSVLGRGVAAPGRPGTGAAISLALHGLALALAVLLAQGTGHSPLPIETVNFPPRPKGPAPARPGPTQPPARPDHIRPRTESPTTPAAPEPARPGLPSGAVDPAAADDGAIGSEALCSGGRCGEPGVEGPGSAVLLGPEMAPPRLLSGPEPLYPAEAARQHIGGTVLVRCTVTEHGVVADCEVIRSLPLLDEPVLRALHARRYTPALSEGRPVAVRMVFTVRVVPP